MNPELLVGDPRLERRVPFQRTRKINVIMKLKGQKAPLASNPDQSGTTRVKKTGNKRIDKKQVKTGQNCTFHVEIH